MESFFTSLTEASQLPRSSRELPYVKGIQKLLKDSFGRSIKEEDDQFLDLQVLLDATDALPSHEYSQSFKRELRNLLKTMYGKTPVFALTSALIPHHLHREEEAAKIVRMYHGAPESDWGSFAALPT